MNLSKMVASSRLVRSRHHHPCPPKAPLAMSLTTDAFIAGQVWILTLRRSICTIGE